PPTPSSATEGAQLAVLIADPTPETGSGLDAMIVAVPIPTADTGGSADTGGPGVDGSDTGTGWDIAVAELVGITVPPDMLVYVVPSAYRVPA
ncbi:hypothetical protein ACFWXT_29950, partial [Bacillus cereus]|uniref:hypothetical protein n=1 Tax=Bacillus cereus TaxID=1396 RepID=UPI00367282A2